MGLSLRGTTSGAVDINAPAVAGDNTITLPGNSGSANQFYKNSGTAGIITHSSMVEDSSGSVGIGTDNPQRKLVVSDGGTEGLEFFPGDSVNGSTINVYNRATSAFTPFSLNAQDYRFSPNGGTEAVRITSAGLVGIGTDTPAAKLTVSGNSDVSDEDCQLRIEDNDTTAASRIPSLAFYASGTETGKIRGSDLSGMVFYTNGSERLTLDTSGNASITDGNLVVASGHGIDFSATSDGSGTMTSELLDDYEEGTFTPGVTFGGGNTGMTFSEAYGTYTKIGRYVFCTFVFSMTNKGSSTGAALLTGLPFNTQNDPNARAGGGVTYMDSLVNLNETPITYATNNANFAYLYQINQSNGTGTATSQVSDANFSNSSSFRAYLSYYTNT